MASLDEIISGNESIRDTPVIPNREPSATVPANTSALAVDAPVNRDAPIAPTVQDPLPPAPLATTPNQTLLTADQATAGTMPVDPAPVAELPGIREVPGINFTEAAPRTAQNPRQQEMADKVQQFSGEMLLRVHEQTGVKLPPEAIDKILRETGVDVSATASAPAAVGANQAPAAALPTPATTPIAQPPVNAAPTAPAEELPIVPVTPPPSV